MLRPIFAVRLELTKDLKYWFIFLLRHWVILCENIFKTLPFQTVGAMDLELWDNVHHPLCQVSHVTCHVSGVRCHLSNGFFFFLKIKIKIQIGGASSWRVSYQWGYPVMLYNSHILKHFIRHYINWDILMPRNCWHHFRPWERLVQTRPTFVLLLS